MTNKTGWLTPHPGNDGWCVVLSSSHTDCADCSLPHNNMLYLRSISKLYHSQIFWPDNQSNSYQIHGVRTMDTFRIIKSLANHLLSLSILLLWQDRQTIWSVYSLSVLVYIWLAAEMITERLTNSETELVLFHFPFISIQQGAWLSEWLDQPPSTCRTCPISNFKVSMFLCDCWYNTHHHHIYRHLSFSLLSYLFIRGNICRKYFLNSYSYCKTSSPT